MTAATVGAVVVAAGAGSRLGGEAKQFRLVGGRPMLEWSCARFAEHPAVGPVVVVVPPGIAGAPPGWLAALDLTLVAGGATRQASVRAGLAALAARTGPAAPVSSVLIHDAARPFVSAALVDRLCRGVEDQPVIPVLPLSDAVKRLRGREGEDATLVESTLDRSQLRAAQTPQAFPFDLILGLHADAAERAGIGNAAEIPVPDDAALCEAAGVPVQTLTGERWAFKITHPEDLAVAEWLVASGRVRWPGKRT